MSASHAVIPEGSKGTVVLAYSGMRSSADTTQASPPALLYSSAHIKHAPHVHTLSQSRLRPDQLSSASAHHQPLHILCCVASPPLPPTPPISHTHRLTHWPRSHELSCCVGKGECVSVCCTCELAPPTHPTASSTCRVCLHPPLENLSHSHNTLPGS